MVFLHAVAQRQIQNDPVALAMVLVILAIFAVMVIRKNMLSKKEHPVTVEAVQPVAEAPKAPGSAGQIKLHNVEPKTAAMLMAIVADQTGKPLNELRFISIKEVE